MRHYLAVAGLALGLMASAACAPHGYMVRMAPPPPPPYARYMGRAPGPRYVWMDGRWAWRGRWVWVPGRWVVPPRPRAVWVPGYWANRHHGWFWVEGRWR